MTEPVGYAEPGNSIAEQHPYIGAAQRVEGGMFGDVRGLRHCGGGAHPSNSELPIGARRTVG